jgi:muramidase (phage lysozyme)
MEINKNRRAWLNMIAASEGTSTSPGTKNNGYDIIVTGIDGKPEIFTDYSKHPFSEGRAPKIINNNGLKSSASGRYQFMRVHWPHYRDLLHLDDKKQYPDGAFSPKAQDDWALQLIRECRALNDIDEGRFEEAIKKCAHLWASLPGAGYKQHENKLDNLLAVYKESGGSVA